MMPVPRNSDAFERTFLSRRLLTLVPEARLSRETDGDVFVFDDNRICDDFDVIVDFRPGIDTIDLSRSACFAGSDFVALSASVRQAGPDVVIDLGPGQGSVTCEATDVSALSEGDFIF
jgi:hypothetical protein